MGRPYLRLQPSDESLAPQTVTTQFRRLHGLSQPTGEAEGLLGQLTGRSRELLGYEVLLVAPGGSQPALDYYLGTMPTEGLDALGRVCSQLFPPGYEWTRTNLAIEELFDGPLGAARQLYGWAERRQDWQMELADIDEFRDDAVGVTTPPLASAAATLAASPYPAVYQALLAPHPDYRCDVRLRRERLLEGRDTFGQRLAAMIFGPLDRNAGDPGLPRPVAARLDELEARDARNSFRVTARLVVGGTDRAATDGEDGAPIPATEAPRDAPRDRTRPPNAGRAMSADGRGRDDSRRQGADQSDSDSRDQAVGRRQDAYPGRGDDQAQRADRQQSDESGQAVGRRDDAYPGRRDDRTQRDGRRQDDTEGRAVEGTGADSAADPDPASADTSGDGPMAQPPAQPETPEAVCERLATAFNHVGGRYHKVVVRPADPAPTWEALQAREHADKGYQRVITRIGFMPNVSPAIVAAPGEAATFCLVGGANLPPPTHQALAPTPSDRTPQSPPPTTQVAPYRTPGFTIGRRTESETPLALPPALQPLHTALFAPTGAGKSTALARGILDNAAATDGADVLLLPKAGVATDYLRAHYARHGTLDDVYYLDCAEMVPALSFFDIRPARDAGVPREAAVETRVDHYLALIDGLMPEDAAAPRSRDVIRYLIRALFDPVHGADAFSHRELHRAATRLATQRIHPPVSDDELATLFASLTDDRSDTFEAIMEGVFTRIEKLPVDRRLATAFNHVAPRPGDRPAEMRRDGPDGADTVAGADARDGADAPEHAASDADTHGDRDGQDDADGHAGGSTADGGAKAPVATEPFTRYLDEDVTIVIDLGTLRGDGQRALLLAVLSALWRALRRRAAAQTDPPLVNCYIEEAATVADTDLLSTLLAQGRGFGLGVTLAMQYPGQLRQADARSYTELLNDVGTIITGPVGHDPDLAARLATDAMPADAVAARLRGLERGRWLVDPAAPFGEPAPQPFTVASATPPAGHPASDEPLDTQQAEAFERQLTACRDRTATAMGCPLRRPATVDGRRTLMDDDATDAPTASRTAPGPDMPPAGIPLTELRGGGAEETALRPRVDSALPYTRRLPRHLEYDSGTHSVVCTHCDGVYEPTADGLEAAASCHPRRPVDRDDIPICQVNLPLDRAARRASRWSDAQLMFLRAVHRAHERRYDPPCYDLLYDSMVRLREYIDIEPEAVDELCEAGLLRHDGDYPHRLYTVTSDGRTAIDAPYRAGVAHGRGAGDVSESSQHVLGVVAGKRLFEQWYCDDPDSPVVTIEAYYEVPAAPDDGEPDTGDSNTDAGDADTDAEDTDASAADVDGDTAAGASESAGAVDAEGTETAERPPTDNPAPTNMRRFDLVGLDADGDVIVTGEVERINNDRFEAIPADYDKMAQCDPEAAIWIVFSQRAGHTLLEVLNDPPDGEPRVERSYAANTPPQQYRLDAPGCTAIYPVSWVRNRLEEPDRRWAEPRQ